jgi:hypothetical protein
MGEGSVSIRFLGSSHFAGLCVIAMVLVSCGGGGSAGPGTPTSPTPTTQPPVSGPTITITSAGVTPNTIDIPVGGRVTFVNNDNAFHEMASNPHPIHTDCPPMNEVGAVAPGQSRTTGAFTVARTCGFHDHGQPFNPIFQGSIVIR